MHACRFSSALCHARSARDGWRGRQSSEHPFQGFRVSVFSGCTEGAGARAGRQCQRRPELRHSQGWGGHTNRDTLRGRLFPRKQSLGLSALESSAVKCRRAVTTPSSCSPSPQTVLRHCGARDCGLHWKNKIEVKTLSLADSSQLSWRLECPHPGAKAILEAGVSSRTPSQPSWKLETVTVLSCPRVGAISKGQLPPTLDTRVCPAVPLAWWRRRLRKPSKEYGLKYLPEVLQNLKSYA